MSAPEAAVALVVRYLSEHWPELLAAVVIEAAAIWFTVAVLDRRAKNREEARLRPARRAVYGKLFRTMDHLLLVIMPDCEYEDDERYARGRLHDYGDMRVFSGVNPASLAQCKRELCQQLSRDESPDVQGRRAEVGQAAHQAAAEVDRITNVAALVLYPATLHLLFLVHVQLGRLAQLPDDSQGWTLSPSDTIDATVDLWKHLASFADSCSDVFTLTHVFSRRVARQRRRAASAASNSTKRAEGLKGSVDG